MHLSGFVDSRGVRIHYLANDLDPKGRSLVFVPGIMMPAWIWDKQLEYFAKDYNVVAIEPRGQGDSDKVSEGLNPVNMAHDIDSVIKKLNLQNIVLIGWSIAVSQVINYAAHFGHLRGLVLVDGIAGIDPSISFYKTMIDQWTQFQMDRLPNTENFVRIIFKSNPDESYIKKLLEVAMQTPTNTMMNLILNYILLDFRPLLPKITIPVWIATVEGPRLDYMFTLNEALPNSKIEVFKSAGHALFVDQPDPFNTSLQSFITQLT